MIYTTKVIHKTQGKAIAEGIYQARTWAYKNGMPGYAEIALNNGKSLVVKSTPNGKITKHYSDGWNIVTGKQIGRASCRERGSSPV